MTSLHKNLSNSINKFSVVIFLSVQVDYERLTSIKIVALSINENVLQNFSVRRNLFPLDLV